MSFKCEICLKEFTQKVGLTKHLNRKNKCDAITPYQCKVCLKYFKHNKNLIDHENKNFCSEKINTSIISEPLFLNEKKDDDQILRDAIRSIINSENIDINSKIDLLLNYDLHATPDQINKVITLDCSVNEMINILISFMKNSKNKSNITNSNINN